MPPPAEKEGGLATSVSRLTSSSSLVPYSSFWLTSLHLLREHLVYIFVYCPFGLSCENKTLVKCISYHNLYNFVLVLL